MITSTVRGEPLYTEKHRPQFHFTSSTDWINDPNGLVYFEGEYHLFFQRVPGSNDGNTATKSWGHAVSSDLVHWTQLDDAISPDANGSIWSGSAVVDWDNTSGFGKDGKPPLVAFYTRMDEKNSSDQRLAYSTDKGRTWTKYDKPIVPHIHGINRDPKVIWHAPTKHWVMALYLDQRHHFALLTSPNLKDWTKLQDVTLEGDDECPDFFPLSLDGDASKQKWIFTAANGKYVVGSFDGRSFTPETDVLTGDHGNGNFYAAQTYSDAPGGRRIQIAWLRDGKFPGMPFNQQLTFPCELKLRSTSNGPRMERHPVREIESLYADTREWKDTPLAQGQNLFDEINSDAFDLDVAIRPGDAKRIALNVRGFAITFDVQTDWDGAITAWDRRVHVPLVDGHLKLRVLVDRASVEIFTGSGIVLSGNVLPPNEARPLSLTVDGGTAHVTTAAVHRIKTAWTEVDRSK